MQRWLDLTSRPLEERVRADTCMWTRERDGKCRGRNVKLDDGHCEIIIKNMGLNLYRLWEKLSGVQKCLHHFARSTEAEARGTRSAVGQLTCKSTTHSNKRKFAIATTGYVQASTCSSIPTHKKPHTLDVSAKRQPPRVETVAARSQETHRAIQRAAGQTWKYWPSLISKTTI